MRDTCIRVAPLNNPIWVWDHPATKRRLRMGAGNGTPKVYRLVLGTPAGQGRKARARPVQPP